MRLLVVLAALFLAACAPAPPPVAKAKPDPASELDYAQTVEQLAALNRKAEALFQAGKYDDAAALVTEGQPLQARILSAREPALEAMEAAADLDDLYGRMLLRNGRYGWARLLFQKNLVRWRNFQPQTAETARRVKLATSQLAECDSKLSQ